MKTLDGLNEVWRPVIGAMGMYEVSNLGRVKSLARSRADGRHCVKERVMTTTLNKGYPRVTLRSNGRTVYRFCHRLVMEAFVGLAPAGQEIRHVDGNRASPRLDNLEYALGRRTSPTANDMAISATVRHTLSSTWSARFCIATKIRLSF
jgi:NUMOD4 motif/HNH endonuclease